MKLGHWSWEGESFDPNDYYGFVYIIFNEKDNKRYIGKKAFWLRKRARPLKGKKNGRISWVKNDWEYYTGSSVELNEDIKKIGKEFFEFTILSIWEFKSSLWYAEIKEIVYRDALSKPNYYYNGQLPAMKFRPKEDPGLWPL